MTAFRREAAFHEAAKRFSRGLLTTPSRPENRLGSDRLFRSLDGLLPQQLAMRADKSTHIAACCTRRAGKTFLSSAWIVEVGMTVQDPEATIFFIAPTMEHAKALLWRRLHEIKRETGLEFKLIGDPAGIEFPSGAKMLFRGAKDLDQLGALVGFKCPMVWVDECQDIRDEVLRFIDVKVSPALRDLGGKLIYTGTPGPVAAGLWWEIATGRRPNWSTHAWSLFDNPHMPEEARSVESICRDEGITPESPRFKRDYLGMWVEDDSLLCYSYDLVRNGEYKFGEVLPEAEWHYVIGVDFGFRDASAVSVVAYSHNHPVVYLVDEFKAKGLTYTELFERGVQPLWRKYGPCVVVGDAAAAQAIAEINSRWGIGMLPSTKGNSTKLKAQYMEIVNSGLVAKRVQIPAESSLAREMSELVWDPSKLPERKEHPRRDNHSCDSFLYAYIQCKDWHQEQPVEPERKLRGDELSGWELAQYGLRQTKTIKDFCNDDDWR